MRTSILILFTILLYFSCKKQSEVDEAFNCNSSTFKNLEEVEGLKNMFSVKLPENWKINLYQDEIQSSIFAADTTKQLTETVLLDITYINNNVNFDDAFMLQQEQDNLARNLVKTKSKKITLLEKPSIYIIYKGNKGQFNYQTCHVFIKINEQNFIFAKIEVYGDSIVNQRFCNAFSLIENLKIHQ